MIRPSELRQLLLVIILFSAAHITSAQVFSRPETFSHEDSLRGSITPERAWWDLQHYHLQIEVVPSTQSIIGSNTITYKVISTHNSMQLDLQSPMKITKVIQDDKELKVIDDGDAHFVQLLKEQKNGEENKLIVYLFRAHCFNNCQSKTYFRGQGVLIQVFPVILNILPVMEKLRPVIFYVFMEIFMKFVKKAIRYFCFWLRKQTSR